MCFISRHNLCFTLPEVCFEKYTNFSPITLGSRASCPPYGGNIQLEKLVLDLRITPLELMTSTMSRWYDIKTRRRVGISGGPLPNWSILLIWMFWVRPTFHRPVPISWAASYFYEEISTKVKLQSLHYNSKSWGSIDYTVAYFREHFTPQL